MKAMDVMGFAGSMAAGVDQAGFDIVGKREPSKFGGFGMESMLYNMPWVEGQVSEPEAWDLPSEPVELVYGCPPCSGFSALSIINTAVHGTTYGMDDPINECMSWFADYVARAKPQVAIMESVALAFRNGRPWLEGVWQRMVDKSGIDYYLTHVIMNAALVGGDVIRPRYFLVASQHPFGVGLDFVQPRNMIEVIADLEDMGDPNDNDWGHVTGRGAGIRRTTQTIEWLKSLGLDWKQGTRFPDNLPEELKNDPPPFWFKERPTRSKRFRNDVYSHYFSTDAFSPVRWKADKPYGVVVAATLFRAVHPTQPRNLTFREAARFMSLPDTWSLRVLVEKDRPAELGKAVPTASAKWISHWAKMAIEGTPGEYAGRETENDRIRVIDVRNDNLVHEIRSGKIAEDGFWENHADPDPALWLVDRKQRPGEWWQREDELGIFDAPLPKVRAPKAARVPAVTTASAPRAKTIESEPAPKAVATIERVQPTVVASLLEELGLTKQAAAEKLGVSVSRINELTTDRRPGSWLNIDRWPSVEETLRA